MDIQLTPDIERALIEEAQREGSSPEELALEYLRARFVTGATRFASDEPRTLAEMLAGHIGVLSSGELIGGGARMSENPAEKFAAGMAKRRERAQL